MARVRLDARSVASLRVDGEREDFFDENLSGFGLRVSELNTKTWFILYRIGNRKRRFKVGSFPAMSLADARERAKVLLSEVAIGHDPMEKRIDERSAETVDELVYRYIENIKLTKSSWKDDYRRLKEHLLPHFGKVNAQKLKKGDVMSILDSFSGTAFKVEPNRVLRTIRRLYNWGIERDLVTINPCAGIKNPKKEYSRPRVLTTEEIKKFWDGLDTEKVDDWLGTKKDKTKIVSIFRLMLTTGQRGAEVKQMEWSEIDFPNQMWVIPKTKMKTRVHHRVPLNDLSMRILKELKLITGQNRFIFPSPTVPDAAISNIQKAAERVREHSKIYDITAHDLRRTLASHMTGMGVPRLVVKKILGHSCSDITAVYDQHEYDFEKMRALRLWNDRLIEILSGKLDFAREEDKIIWTRTNGQLSIPHLKA
jgi:integrase